MSVFELVALALSALIRNRLRSLLTILGIVIGVAAVITLVSFGSSFQNYVDAQFQGQGATRLIISASNPNNTAAAAGYKPKPLTMGDVAAIADSQNVPDISTIAPVYNLTGTLVANEQSLSQSVTGATAPYLAVQGRQIGVGRFISDADVTSVASVVVIGTGIVTKLYPNDDTPVGETMKINGSIFTIIGILQSTSGGNGAQDNVAIIPVTTAQQRLASASARTATGEYTVSQITVLATDSTTITAATNEITILLNSRHQIQNTSEQDFRVFSLTAILSSLNSVLGLLTIFLAAIAGISLLVGGIGVMNIMLVSVRERTREIGLRKAVGARYGDLLMQFLIESVTLSVAGGLIGVVIGSVISIVGGSLLPTLTLTISVPAIVLSVAVSTAIGVFFGLYPASHAAVLKPIEALRYE